MKMSTGLLLLAFSVTSLNGGVTLPAFADDNTAVTGGTGNCSTARDGKQASGQHCLTKPREGQKTGSDQYADERTKLQAGRIKSTTYSASGVSSNGNRYEANRYSDGSGDIRSTDAKTSITTYTVRNANGSISTFTSRPGPGGSGGSDNWLYRAIGNYLFSTESPASRRAFCLPLE